LVNNTKFIPLLVSGEEYIDLWKDRSPDEFINDAMSIDEAKRPKLSKGSEITFFIVDILN
jgi:hypothetical protein